MKHKKELAKIFSSILRDVAKENQTTGVNLALLKFLTRKDLIQILHEKFKGNIPKTLNLIELENDALLELIKNDLFIVSYFTKLWCEELSVRFLSSTLKVKQAAQ